MDVIYKIDNLSFNYKNHSKIDALSGLSLSIQRKDRLAVLGASGLGKSTFLKLLHGLLIPNEGSITFKGLPLTSPPKEVSFLLQSYGLFPWKTVSDNLNLPLLLKGKKNDSHLIDTWLDRLNLKDKKNSYPNHLSGGQRQRLALGRAMINNPECLLLDEPFSALDTLTREDLQNFTLDLAKEKEITLVLVTHNIEEAIFLSTHLLLFTTKGYHFIKNPLDDTRQRNSMAFSEFTKTIRMYLEGDQL